MQKGGMDDKEGGGGHKLFYRLSGHKPSNTDSYLCSVRANHTLAFITRNVIIIPGSRKVQLYPYKFHLDQQGVWGNNNETLLSNDLILT